MDGRISREDRYEMAIQNAAQRWAGPVRYGKDDCLMALADLILEVEGVDVAARYRRKYRSRNGALRVLGKLGVAGAVARASRRLGLKPMPPARCQTGSLGLVMTPEGAAGVVRHRDMWLGRAAYGFSTMPSTAVLKAWGAA